MGPVTQKRPLEGKSSTTKPRKRQRASNGAVGQHVVSLDDLNWSEVPLPDRLDDVEGFLGLEEVEGVDVVRTGDQGKIEYRSLAKPGKNATDYTSRNGSEMFVTEDTGSDEWSGFNDDSDDGSSASVAGDADKASDKQENPPKPPNSKAKVAKKDLKKTKQKGQDHEDALNNPGTRQTSAQPANGFAGLEDDELDGKEADVSAWNALHLSAETLSALSKLGFSRPTPIQSSAIPEILHGHDVIGKASTGSGKTLTFGIPILEHYIENHRQRQKHAQKHLHGKVSSRDPPIALILSPTRELAVQLSTHLTALFSGITMDGPKVATVTGGLSLHKQQRLLAHANIVIGTPGRLWEVISEGHGLVKWLRKIKFLVVDEADRLLSEGHFKEAEEILNALERNDNDDEVDDELVDHRDTEDIERQTLVFSATFNKGLQRKLAGKIKPGGSDLMNKKQSTDYLLQKLNFREPEPQFVDVNPVAQMAAGLREGLVECASTEKDLYLYALLLYYPNARTLIFTNSIASVRRLTPFLQNLNLPALALHSEMPQKARLRSVERFSSPTNPSSILIATDIAARGLDIQGVQLIVHYHLPRAADMYVHRSGRTARAETLGSSVLLCAPEEVAGVRRLIARVHANAANTSSSRYFMRSLDIDRRMVTRLKPRTMLAKKIADSTLAKEKKGHSDEWLRNAAEELGVDYDSEEFEAAQGSRKGRGSGRLKAEREARQLTKGEVGALRAELKALLATRVNVGVSESYLTNGSVDIEQLLEGQKGEFLGTVDALGFEDR